MNRTEVTAYSEAIDFNNLSPQPIRSILLVNPGDLRHIWQTIANVTQRTTFYIEEQQTPLLARHLMSLDFKSDYQELESWLVDKQTIVRIKNRAKAVRDGDTQVDTSMLKCRERDDLVETLTMYTKDHEYAETFWDERLRRDLGNRYDSRANLFDWDFNMKLVDIHPDSKIFEKEYKEWRNSGSMAGGREVNPTLMTVWKEKWGYWSDMTVGPFLRVLSETHLLKKENNQYTRTYQEIMQSQSKRLFERIETNHQKFVNIVFLSTGRPHKIHFDLVYLGYTAVLRGKEFSNNSIVVTECSDYLVGLNNEQKLRYNEIQNQ